MKDFYYIDLESYSLDKFENRLLTRDLLPGRKLLLADLESRFLKLKKLEIQNLKQLLNVLKNKKKMEQVSMDIGIPLEYLTILRREAGSFLPTLVSLEKLIEPENIKTLRKIQELGIKNSKQLFEAAYSIKLRKDLAQKVDSPYALLTKWVQLCDLLRINGVGPIFAHMLYEAGIDNAECFISMPSDQMLKQVNAINELRNYTKVGLRPEDIDYCLEYVKELDLVLEID